MNNQQSIKQAKQQKPGKKKVQAMRASVFF
jgi:hypothetical protein